MLDTEKKNKYNTEKKNKYTLWAIMAIRDVLAYQTGEQLDKHLDLLADLVGEIEEKIREEKDFSEEEISKFFDAIIERSLSILPVTQKAIDKYDKP